MQMPHILSNLTDNIQIKSILLVGPCHLNLVEMATTLANFYHKLPIFLSPSQFDTISNYTDRQVFITKVPIPSDTLHNNINIIVSHKTLTDPVINTTIRFCTHPIYTWALELKTIKPTVGGQNVTIIQEWS